MNIIFYIIPTNLIFLKQLGWQSVNLVLATKPIGSVVIYPLKSIQYWPGKEKHETQKIIWITISFYFIN
jgi:hypothetical protein